MQPSGKAGTWGENRSAIIKYLADRLPPHILHAAAHVEAKAEMIRRALAGFGPDDPPKPGQGVRAVVNMASIHVPAFVRATGSAYQNSYDKGKDVRLEQVDPGKNIPVRTLVDHALELASGIQQDRIYFAAAELNGTGVRFYGDVCLVLASRVDSHTPIVETNSYDVLRPPRTPSGEAPSEAQVNAEIAGMTGTWETNFVDIATIKILARTGDGDRLLTTGQISDALLHDEVYVEILLDQSFDIKAVAEARSSVADTAVENQIAEVGRLGPAPTAAEFEWRNQRRAARRALAAKGKPLRTVATSGRVK